jgi:uncharacterized protein
MESSLSKSSDNQPTSTEVGVVDASVRVVVKTGDELRDWMERPWSLRPFPGPERYQYASPDGEYWPGAVTENGIPGSDPAQVARQLLEDEGVDVAILLPGTRGLLPNVDLDSAICAATNRWLAETWLGEWNEHGRFRGTIRVAPGDPRAAVQEIERWAEHEHMVQVAVPMQAHQPYGKRAYLPIWEAAAECGLPVAIHIDGGSGVDYHPTSAGYLRYATEYGTLYPLNFAFHLGSFITEGVFDRIEALKVVFTDGGFDMLPPLMWRFDKDWRPTREETPWVERAPSEYLRDHVRFCSNALELSDDPEIVAEWLEIGDAEHLLLFASNYPQRDYDPPSRALSGIDRSLRRRIMSDNARELYGLEQSVAVVR